MKAYDLLATAVASSLSTNLFGVMGDANMGFVSSFGSKQDGHYIGCTHEAAAVSMADGYYRATGRPGIATATFGPGLSNCLTPMLEAAHYGSALLLLTGSNGDLHRPFQGLEVRQFAQVAGAHYEKLYSVDTASQDLARALWRVHTADRPVILDVPSHLTNAEVSGCLSSIPSAPEISVRGPSPAEVSQVARRLAAAERPMLLVGDGLSVEPSVLYSIAKEFGAVVGETLLAKDRFASAENYIGLVGGFATSLVKERVRAADLVLALGCSLNEFTAGGSENLFEGSYLIQCDVKPQPPAHRVLPHQYILADAAKLLEELASHRQENHVSFGQESVIRPNSTLPTKPQGSAGYLQQAESVASAEGPTFAEVATTLDALLPRDANIISDLGRFVGALWSRLSFHPRRFTHTGTYGSIGLGLATANGYAVGRPETPTFLLVGDGSYYMSLQELATTVSHSLPVSILLMNDGAYGAEYDKLAQLGLDPQLSLNPWSTVQETAEAFGFNYLSIRNRSELASLDNSVLLAPRTLIDFQVNPAGESLQDTEVPTQQRNDDVFTS